MPMTTAEESAVFGNWRGASLPKYLDLRAWCEQTMISYTTARQMISDGRLRAVTANGGKTFRIPVTELTRVFTPVKPKGGQ
jgi:excisionase family DNA binding protein